jgi:hypothetical protein
MVNIEKLIEKLPMGYAEKCYETKGIERNREIKSGCDLMLLNMTYLSQKCSLLEVSEIARVNGIANLSDVAYMKRFAKCNEWFKWILSEITPSIVTEYALPASLRGYRPLAIDMSKVVSKGAVKTTYHLHYATDIFKMTSCQYKITNEKTGESLLNFVVEANDLIIGDRGYGKKSGIEYCLNNGGQFIFRIKNKAFDLYDEDKKKIELLEFLEKVTSDAASEMTVYMLTSTKEFLPLRLCAIKKTAQNIEKSDKRLHRRDSRRQTKTSDETKKTHEYIFVITSLPTEISADEILEAYRYRWQVELYFKRLKSIMDFGDLPVKNHNAIITWLNGKLMVAMLIETIISEVDFSPHAI